MNKKNIIKCNCGHAIVSKDNDKKIIKCFKCNSYLENINGKWLNTGLVVERKQPTIKNILELQIKQHLQKEENLKSNELKKILARAY